MNDWMSAYFGGLGESLLLRVGFNERAKHLNVETE